MNKSILFFTMLVSIMTLSQTAFAVTDYSMSCRGKLNYATGTGGDTTVLFIKKNAYRAGPNGTWLEPGTCAWQDRPIASTEPTRIFIPDYKNFTNGRVNSSGLMALMQCASDENCVINFYVHNVSNSYFKSNSPTYSFVKFPF